jgi:hypothetical protein
MSQNSISVQGKTSIYLIVDYDVDVQPGGGEEVQVPLPDVPHHDIRPSVFGSQLHRRLLPRNIPGMEQITIKTPNPKCRPYWCLIEFIDCMEI